MDVDSAAPAMPLRGALVRPPAGRVRVLHIVLDLNAGGLERLVADLVRRADPARFENHVLALRFLGRNARGLEPANRLHVAAPLPRWTMAWPRPLIRQIRELAPDVVHTHSGVWYKASLAARWAGVPRLIHTDHGRPYPDPLGARLLDRLAAGRTDVIVAVSAALAQQLVAGVVADRRRLRVVPNGVDAERFRPRPDDGGLRRELGLDPAAPIIGSVYALAGNTNQSLLYSNSASLFDVISGSNGSCGGTYLCTGVVGFDGPTGNGTPNGIGAF